MSIQNENKPINTAIDGPSGAGKSTVARGAAKRLGFLYVDTGALYRAIGLYVKRANTDPDSADAVASLLPEIHVSLSHGADGEQHVFLCGEDVSAEIRENEISAYASAVSALPPVREFLLGMQRSIAKSNSVIMDGRDIGTVVLPDADVKIFLTASAESRAKRRLKELHEKGRTEVTYEQLLSEMADRDRRDMTRTTAPLVPAKDAVLLDTSELTLEESIERVVRLIQTQAGL